MLLNEWKSVFKEIMNNLNFQKISLVIISFTTVKFSETDINKKENIRKKIRMSIFQQLSLV